MFLTQRMDAAQFIAQLQLPNHPDGQDDALRDTVKALECFGDVRAGCCRAAGMALQNRDHVRRIRIPLQRERSGADLDTIDLAVLVRPRARRYRRNGVSETWHFVSPTLLA
jgi:hypothetical protein